MVNKPVLGILILIFGIFNGICKAAACNCENIKSGIHCHCEGNVMMLPNNLANGSVHSLSIAYGNTKNLSKDSLLNYKESLSDLTIIRMKNFTNIEDGALDYMPHITLLRIVHTYLKRIPKIRGLGKEKPVHIVDFESNMIDCLVSNNMEIATDQLFLDYNRITTVQAWAFKGSEIGKLSLRGNKMLNELSADAFCGLKSLRDLDLSETSILNLPTSGLKELELLHLTNTPSLKTIPSIYDLPKLQIAHLTYFFHCCAFFNPAKHDPVKHKQHLDAQVRYCSDDLDRKRRNAEDGFGDFMEDIENIDVENFNFTITKNNYTANFDLEEQNWNSKDGFFHNRSVQIPSYKIHELCGNLTKRILVRCWPEANPLNPCEDMLSWVWLRVSLWIVISTALFGNFVVLLVLFTTSHDRTLTRLLMSNLAIADLLMAIYLLILAIMDLISVEEYFNYAASWQLGIGCDIAGFLTVFSSQLSLFTLSLLTIERWSTIRRALYLPLINVSNAFKIMAVGWIYSIIMANLPLFGISSYSATSICLPMDTHNYWSVGYILILVGCAAFAFVVMCICYVQIYLSLSYDTRHSAGEGSIARKITILVGTNLICWAPVAFFSLTALSGYPLINVTQSKVLLVFIYPFNSCANPYLYAILTKQFRKDFKQLLSRYGLCKDEYSIPPGNGTPAAQITIDTYV